MKVARPINVREPKGINLTVGYRCRYPSGLKLGILQGTERLPHSPVFAAIATVMDDGEPLIHGSANFLAVRLAVNERPCAPCLNNHRLSPRFSVLHFRDNSR